MSFGTVGTAETSRALGGRVKSHREPLTVLIVDDEPAMRMVLEAPVILALLGSIDSLLTSLVADTMTGARHKSNQELIGQGSVTPSPASSGGSPAQARRCARW